MLEPVGLIAEWQGMLTVAAQQDLAVGAFYMKHASKSCQRCKTESNSTVLKTFT